MGTTQQVILTTTVTASAALTQQRFVGADNAPCQAGAVALGVAEVDAAAGDVTPVNVLGIVAVEAGAAIARAERSVGCKCLRRSPDSSIRRHPGRYFSRDCAG